MPRSSGIRAVVFDVDGVLITVRFPTVLPTALGIPAAEASLFFAGPFLDCLAGRTELRDVLPPYLMKWGWKGSFEEFTDFWFDTESHVHLPTLEVADWLRASGLRCFLASTQERLRAQHLEQTLGVGERFEQAFFSCRLGCQKPEQKFYATVAAAVGLRPNELLLLDDQPQNVEGAQAMGWQAALFHIGEDLDALLESYGIRRAG